MATILAHIKIRDGHEATFEALAKQLYEETHANEDNVVSYQYWRGSEPSTYYTLLAFADYNSFLVHQTSEHHDDVGKGLSAAIEHMKLEWVDPIEGASPFPRTTSQELPADATDTDRSTAATYAAVIADWWHSHRDS